MPKLTKTLIDSTLKARADVWLWDSEVPGFGVRIQPSDRRTYVARYRNKAGRQRKLTIARVCDMPPQQARDMARQVFTRVAGGDDPAMEKKELRSGEKVSDLCARYLATCKLKPSSLKNARINVRVHIIPAIGSMPVSAVTQADIRKLHERMHKTPTTANRVLSLASAMFRMVEVPNPCRGVRKYQEHERDTILSREQVRELVAKLQGMPVGFSRMVRLLLLTGCRKSEIKDAKVEWVDFNQKLLRLPDSKTGPKNVALSDAALDIIREADGLYICPGVRTDRPIQSVGRYWKQLCLQGVRIHDLRHTVASHAFAAGLTQREVADLLGHRKLSTTSRYIQATGRVRAADVVSGLW